LKKIGACGRTIAELAQRTDFIPKRIRRIASLFPEQRHKSKACIALHVPELP